MRLDNETLFAEAWRIYEQVKKVGDRQMILAIHQIDPISWVALEKYCRLFDALIDYIESLQTGPFSKSYPIGPDKSNEPYNQDYLPCINDVALVGELKIILMQISEAIDDSDSHTSIINKIDKFRTTVVNSTQRHLERPEICQYKSIILKLLVGFLDFVCGKKAGDHVIKPFACKQVEASCSFFAKASKPEGTSPVERSHSCP